ncbi:duf974 domain containing protein [Naviculisporaceae sp. PSN 640]
MSHQRYPSHSDAVKEPHSVSLKVLRLSRPSLVAQYPVQPPPFLLGNDDATRSQSHRHPPPMPASLAYSPVSLKKKNNDNGESTNSDPFILSPMVNLPPSFGSAYVGETFSCTLCVNHDALALEDIAGGSKKTIRDVRIEAEMKTPTTAATAANAGVGAGGGAVVKLPLSPPGPGGVDDASSKGHGHGGVDLLPGETVQKIVNFDLKDEGNHVLAVTVSYYEATETSGRTRTFRKLYQFICKASLIVRTKAGPLPRLGSSQKGRRWVLEAQLENCSEDAMQLEKADMELEEGLVSRGLNWDVLGGGGQGEGQIEKPVLHPGEVEQVCFVIEEVVGDDGKGVREQDGRVVFGVLGVGWRSEMGNRGFLTTGKLGTRHVKPV